MSPEERVKEHRANIPKQYRRAYDIAQTGRSLRAAINSQCIECMGYVYKEVKECCSPQCALYRYRPLQGISHGIVQPTESKPESTNSNKRQSGRG